MPAREIADFLTRGPVFGTLPAKEILALAVLAREERYGARDYIFREGDPAAWFCIVRSGRVKILRQTRGGRDVVLELLGPGEPFGGVAVIERRPYPASAQCTEASTIVKIPQEPVTTLAERYPSIIREMALLIGRRLRGAHDAVESLASDPVEARLAATVLRLAEREGASATQDSLALPFHLTRQSLADMTGTTVETTIRVLSRWLKRGLVREMDGRLVVPSVAALRALTETEGE
jgi:CRP-like cAMP-binding protein